jgi:hypothetical protein
MEEDLRMLLESYWEGLLTRSEFIARATELASEHGKTYEQLAQEFGFNPKSP